MIFPYQDTFANHSINRVEEDIISDVGVPDKYVAESHGFEAKNMLPKMGKDISPKANVRVRVKIVKVIVWAQHFRTHILIEKGPEGALSAEVSKMATLPAWHRNGGRLRDRHRVG